MEWHQSCSNWQPCSAWGEELASPGRWSLQWAVSVATWEEKVVVASFCTHGSIVHKLLYSHTLSTFTLGPEEGFANSEPDPCGEDFDSSIGLRHWSRSMTHIHSGLHPFFTYSLKTSSTPHLWGHFLYFWLILENRAHSGSTIAEHVSLGCISKN